MQLIWCLEDQSFRHLWSPFWWWFGVKLLSWWDDACIINNSRCSCHQHSVNTAAVLGKRLSLMMSGNKHNRYAHTRRNLRRTCTAAAHQQSKPVLRESWAERYLKRRPVSYRRRYRRCPMARVLCYVCALERVSRAACVFAAATLTTH